MCACVSLLSVCEDGFQWTTVAALRLARAATAALTLAAKPIYSCRQRPRKFEVALETELVVAFVFNESEVSDALYVC